MRYNQRGTGPFFSQFDITRYLGLLFLVLIPYAMLQATTTNPLIGVREVCFVGMLWLISRNWRKWTRQEGANAQSSRS